MKIGNHGEIEILLPPGMGKKEEEAILEAVLPPTMPKPKEEVREDDTLKAMQAQAG